MTIHLITAGKYQNQENWPDIWVKCFESISKTPYDICIWNDEGIDKLLKEDDYKFYQEYLVKLDPIYSWDYVRYIILEKYRGAYFDMDVELIDSSFLAKLNFEKIYVKEGYCGSYIENSIMISQSPYFDELWGRLKMYCKSLIVNNFEKALNSPKNPMIFVGPDALSKFFISNVSEKEKRLKTKKYELLAHEHFGSLTNEISFARHHVTSAWL